MKQNSGIYFIPSDNQLERRLLKNSPRGYLVRDESNASPLNLEGVLSAELAIIYAMHDVKISLTHVGRSPFHIQHQSTPRLISQVLNVIYESTESSPGDLSRATTLNEYSLKATVLPFIRQLGLINISRGRQQVCTLTHWGRQLTSVRSSSPALLAEAIHVHLVTRWRVNPAMRASWAYAVTAGCLWERTPVDLLPPLRQRIVTAVREAGATAYGLPIERVAFSTNSVAGVLHWLGALEPPVIVARGRTREVRRRVACPAAAVWWSVGALDRSEGWGGGSGTWVALDETRRDLLARALFLEPTALPDVLARAATASEALPGGPCLRYDEARDAVEVVRTVPVGTYPGITEEAGHP